MSHKRKRPGDLIPIAAIHFLKRFAEALSFALMVTATASAVAILVVLLLQPTRDRSQYRFCLATESGDSCVHRPGIVIGSKIHKSPDKLLEFFGGIPERVQQKWRVWIMDVKHSNTTELTVAEFYAWIDGVWKAQDRAGGGL